MSDSVHVAEPVVAPRRLQIDPRLSYIAFTVKYFGRLRAEGYFAGIRGEVICVGDGTFLPQEVSAVVAMDSLSTGIRLRDVHLTSRAYLDARRWPSATFHGTTTRVTPAAKDDGAPSCRLSGELTMRGLTRALDIDVTGVHASPPSRTHPGWRVVALGTGTVRRNDYGVGVGPSMWRDPLSWTIANEVSLTVYVEAVESLPSDQ